MEATSAMWMFQYMSGGLSVFFIGIARIFWLCCIYCGPSTIKKLKNEWIAARRWFLVAALQLCSSSIHWRKRSINSRSTLAIVSFSGQRFSWSLQYLKNKENESLYANWVFRLLPTCPGRYVDRNCVRYRAKSVSFIAYLRDDICTGFFHSFHQIRINFGCQP